jgi:hypothetical protein
MGRCRQPAPASALGRRWCCRCLGFASQVRLVPRAPHRLRPAAAGARASQAASPALAPLALRHQAHLGSVAHTSPGHASRIMVRWAITGFCELRRARASSGMKSARNAAEPGQRRNGAGRGSITHAPSAHTGGDCVSGSWGGGSGSLVRSAAFGLPLPTHWLWMSGSMSWRAPVTVWTKRAIRG